MHAGAVEGASDCAHITKVGPNGGFVETKNMSNEVHVLPGSLSLRLSQFLLCTDNLLCITFCVYFIALVLVVSR